MNYVIYTYNKINNWKFRFFPNDSNTSNDFWHFVCILYNKLLCLISDFDSAYFSVYGNILEIYVSTFVDPQNRIVRPPLNRTFSQKCEQFSYRGFLVLNGPLTSLYLLSIPSSTGGPWRPRETTGDHRGQFPRTDSSLASEI